MNFLDDSWLVGTSTGLYAAADRRWERLGAYQFIVTGFDRSGGRLLASTGSGLWEIRQDRWVQRHDETLTEVMDVIDEGDRMIAASAYGIAFGRTEPSEATRWDWLSDGLSINQRFTNALLSLADGRIVAATEAGVMIHSQETEWQATSLQGTPVRCLARWRDSYLAGSDEGIWSSDDAKSWHLTDRDEPMYALASGRSHVLAGTEDGVCVSTDARQWRTAGLGGMRIGAVETSRADDDCWYAGGVPGGLWMTRNRGQTWVDVPEVISDVNAISAPPGFATEGL
jgi:hypothetical protein